MLSYNAMIIIFVLWFQLKNFIPYKFSTALFSGIFVNIIIFFVYISLGPAMALHLKYNTLVNYNTSDTALS